MTSKDNAGSPLIDPAIAGGTAVVALATAGTVLALRRRRHTMTT